MGAHKGAGAHLQRQKRRFKPYLRHVTSGVAFAVAGGAVVACMPGRVVLLALHQSYQWRCVPDAQAERGVHRPAQLAAGPACTHDALGHRYQQLLRYVRRWYDSRSTVFVYMLPVFHSVFLLLWWALQRKVSLVSAKSSTIWYPLNRSLDSTCFRAYVD
jgi:hypothetical protein